MGDSKFFTNTLANTLFDKFSGILTEMQGLHSFHAVVGYFRSSGYYAIREKLQGLGKVQILVGINIDDIFRQRTPGKLFMLNDKAARQAREQFRADFVGDVRDADYYKQAEEGVSLLVDDLRSGRVEMKIHATKDLHAKFYLFLPEKHTPHSDGWVIMGSSNLSESGLGLTQPPRYELNVAMKDYGDVAFCKAEFEKLWKEALPLSPEDIERFRAVTHLGQAPTPYELYLKFLIDYFGAQIEDEFSLAVPEGFADLKYQHDAVSQGYQMLKRYNGFFLADVVGLGKTVVAAMTARRFIEENSMQTSRVLVVHPPKLFDNWRSTFEMFNIGKYADFVSCGSLERLFEEENEYLPLEEYDLVIVDEAHRFRGDMSNMYDLLQRVCKTDRVRDGRVGGAQKLVMLVSATPLNISPKDLYNLLLLFQDKRKSNIDGVPNLQNFFAPLIRLYTKLMSSTNREIDVEAVKRIYEEIRKKVIDQVTVRRTRENILNYPEYREDLKKQGIVFPKIEKPRELVYYLAEPLKVLFNETMEVLTERLRYARYRAIDNLVPSAKENYHNAAQISASLAGIYRVHMVKRLESSFEAFRRSLHNLRRNTQGMVGMWNADRIIIAPDLKVKELQDKGFELDDIIEKGVEKFGAPKEQFVYGREAFHPTFLDDLQRDIALLDDLIAKWEQVTVDPKLDKFIEAIRTRMLDPQENPTGKLVIFSESKDTVNYLERELKRQLGRNDILSASSDSNKKLFETILSNFKPRPKGKVCNDYNILITTDVLSEGVDLHRANVIVHYDSPWNPTRLMQRNGRVNRIGSIAPAIYNYLFYPSAEGDAEIRLYRNILAKLQGFHSAYGEDSQIFSREEVVGSFELFNPHVGDDVDKVLQYLEEVRKFRKLHPSRFEQIKNLPVKSRAGRSAQLKEGVRKDTALVCIRSSFKQEFYKVETNPDPPRKPGDPMPAGPKERFTVSPIGFLEAAELFRAAPDEKPLALPEDHYQSVTAAQRLFDKEITAVLGGAAPAPSVRDTATTAALKFLRWLWRNGNLPATKENCDILSRYVEQGIFSKPTRELNRLERRLKQQQTDLESIEELLDGFVARYHVSEKRTGPAEDPRARVILSEYFL